MKKYILLFIACILCSSCSFSPPKKVIMRQINDYYETHPRVVKIRTKDEGITTTSPRSEKTKILLENGYVTMDIIDELTEIPPDAPESFRDFYRQFNYKTHILNMTDKIKPYLVDKINSSQNNNNVEVILCHYEFEKIIEITRKRSIEGYPLPNTFKVVVGRKIKSKTPLYELLEKYDRTEGFVATFTFEKKPDGNWVILR